MIRTTLIIFPGALGDFICFLPTLRALCEGCRDARVAVVAQAALHALAVRPGLADGGVALERAAVAKLFVRGANPASTLPDAVIGDVYSWFASRDPVVRDNLRRLARGTVCCAPFAMPAEFPSHVARYFLETAGLDSHATARAVSLPLRPVETERAWSFWRQHRLVGRSVLAVHRGGGNIVKRWAEAGYHAVTRWWRGRGGAVLEFAGPADPPEPLARDHVMAQGLALDDVAAVLARADLFLGCDSGLSHLAGAVGLRGVAVFGPTQPRSWRPLGGRIMCLKSPTPVGTSGPISLGAVSSQRVIRALSILAGQAVP
jgi:ADP-heptose:LPS heptosyltransferase